MNLEEALDKKSKVEEALDRKIKRESSLEKALGPIDISKIEAPPIPTPAYSPSQIIPEAQQDTILGMQMEGARPLAKSMGITKDEPFIEPTAKYLGKQVIATTELAMSVASGMLLYLPSKMYGVMALPFGREVADVAEEEIGKLGYQPYTELGKEATELVGKGFELFLSPAKNVGDYVSRLSPRLGYLVELGAELAEFAMTGMVIKKVKGAKVKFRPSVAGMRRLFRAKEELEVDTIKAKERMVEQIPDEVVKEAQMKILEVEKQQLKLELDALKERFDKETIKEDLREKGKKIEEVKSGLRIAEERQVEIERAFEEKVKVAIEKKIEPPKPKPKIEPEPITEADRQTGVSVPALEGEKSPFFQTKEKADAMAKVYEGRKISSVEVLTQKLINDVNRAYHGDKSVDVIKARNELSEIVTRADELNMAFDNPADFREWKSTVEEAAIWARRTEPLRLIKKRREGIELYSGIPLDKAGKLIVKSAKEFNAAFNKALGMKKLDFSYAFKKAKVETTRALIERSEGLMKELVKQYGDEGYRIVQRQRAAAGGYGYGKVVYDQINKEVFRGRSEREIMATNALILAERFKDIYGYRAESTYKHPEGMGSTQAIAFTEVGTFIRGLSKEESARARRSAKAYFEHMRKMVDDMVESGLKSKEEGELLKAHNFRKFKSLTVDSIYDYNYSVRLKDKPVSVHSSGVEPLGRGSTKILEPDARLVASEMATKIYGRISNNETLKSWADFARNHPTNKFVLTKELKDPSGAIIPVPRNWSRVYFWEEGIEKTLHFHPDAIIQVLTRSQDISFRLGKVIGYGFGAPLVRALATGTSPAWATFAGFPMDVFHTFFSARTYESGKKFVGLKKDFPFMEIRKGKYRRVYSPFAPVYALQLGRDLTSTFHDTFTRGPKYQNYAKYGGMMPFLTQREAKFTRGVKPPGNLAKALDLAAFHGLSMELWMRHAVQDRIIRRRAKGKGISYEAATKNKDIMYEATHVARERMDYHQGGWLIKAMDQALPFTSAGALGARTFWRNSIENPIDFGFRVANIGIAATGITAVGWMMYPKVMKEIPAYDQKRNVTFPLFPGWLSFRDEEGNERFFYLKLTQDPGAAFFHKFFSTITQTYLYDRGLINHEPDYEEVIEALKSQLPTETILPPNLQALVGYATNYSWWKDRQMYTDAGGRTFDWPESRHEVKKGRESQLATDTGKVTGLSPKRLEEAASSVLPAGNEFVYLFGKAYETMFSDVPKEMRKQHWAMTLAKVPGIRRIIGITQPRIERAVRREEIYEEDLLERVIRNGQLEFLSEGYHWKKVGNYQNVKEFIRSHKDLKVRDSLREKDKFIKDVKTLSHRRYWVNMYHFNPKVKAQEYYELISKVDPEEYEQIMEEKSILTKAGGFFTENFWLEFRKIRREKE